MLYLGSGNVSTGQMSRKKVRKGEKICQNQIERERGRAGFSVICVSCKYDDSPAMIHLCENIHLMLTNFAKMIV